MNLERRPVANVPHRVANTVFHDYVRGVFAEYSVRSRAVRERRTRWLKALAPALTARGVPASSG